MRLSLVLSRRSASVARPLNRIVENMFKAVVLIFLAVAALSIPGCTTDPKPSMLAVGSANAGLGRAYAERTCTACHAVGASEMRSPDPRARSFDAIASTPGMTRTALDAWLHSSHTNMPNLIVEPEHVDDLYAYLFTLKHRV